MVDYNDFIRGKGQLGGMHGFKPLWIPDWLFDFQQPLTEWAILKGRGLKMADCGMGKTPMQLVFAENVVRHTNKPFLIVTPLAVARQTVQEAEKFDIEASRSSNGRPGKNITVTNYERLHLFDPDDFGGCAIDESSAIKNFEGERQKLVNEFLRRMPYRLLLSATAAPNDYIELLTSADALGEMGRMDALGMFFKNDENSNHPIWWGARWRFRKWGEDDFWRWVCSWARAVRKPSDMGFPDGPFVLPPLNISETVVTAANCWDMGFLFPMQATTLRDQQKERKVTVQERCEEVVRKCEGHDHSVIWCHGNEEGNLLEKITPNSRQISGSNGQSDEEKEEIYQAFADKQLQRLIIKPKIGAWGLNWQHCNHMTYFPSHSFEQWYQSVRRCWRFGQKRPVYVDIITTEGELGVMKNLQRKADAAEKMFDMLVQNMNNELKLERASNYTGSVEVPSWL
jgi:hypothetical protein